MRGPAPEEDREVYSGRFGRVGEFLARHLRVPRTALGFILALALVGGIGSLLAAGGLFAQQWSETAGFCGHCHTVTAEVNANKLSVHRDVACGKCHIGPGLGGFVKAKMNGAKEALSYLTSTYPTPIPAPDHSDMPATTETCLGCHSLEEISKEGSPTKLIMHPRYREDKANTKEMVAVMVRPYHLGEGRSIGAHWHVQQKIEFASPEADAQKIDWIRVTERNGKTREFIDRTQVGVSSDVKPDIRRLTQAETTRPMDCITCHNRIGHEFPLPGEAIDKSLASGKISPSLPYIKREGVSRLSKSYDSVGEADKAIEGIRGMYAVRYPLLARTKRPQINRAVGQLKLLYRLVADPEMKMLAADYPNNLGHQSGPGCFRCHDGAHFEVGPGGRLLNKTIPWECNTCHTFPQSGPTISSLSLLGRPPDHRSKLWVFNHKYAAEKLEPDPNSSFCSNCHSSGAAKVNHDEMLYRHPEAIANAGIQACAYCHQEVFCARCHKKPVMKDTEAHLYNEARLIREANRK
jgi:nitrate/TMAO reductase-like tetraheme cytochrome c subunit